MDFLAEYARYLQDMVDGVSLPYIFYFFSCGVFLSKIQGGATCKDSYLARNPAVCLCCAKSVSGDDCSIPGTIFFTVVEEQPSRKYV